MKYYHPNGIPVFPDDVDEEVDWIEAVGEDDKVVKIVGCDRIRAGAPGTGESASITTVWHCRDEEQFPEGFCKLIREIPAAIERAARKRQEAGKAWKRFKQNHEFLGHQLFDDPELRNEILEEGIDKWLEDVK